MPPAKPEREKERPKERRKEGDKDKAKTHKLSLKGSARLVAEFVRPLHRDIGSRMALAD